MKKRFIVLFLLSSSLCSCGQAQSLFYICNSNQQLLKVDLGTCDTTFIGLSSSPLYDIALTPDNKLYGIYGVSLYDVDTSNAFLTAIATLPTGGNSLVSDSAGDLLTVANDSVFQINRFTGQMFSLGFFGTYTSAGDLTFYHDTLYLSAD